MKNNCYERGYVFNTGTEIMNRHLDTTEACREDASLFFFRNMDTVRLVAFCVSPAKHLLDDIVHDSYIQFVENASSWDYSRDLLPLLKKITRNMAFQHWKQYKKTLPDSIQELGEILRMRNESGPSSSMQSMLAAMEHCLKKVSPENKEIFELHYIDGESIVELARKLQKKPSALYSFFTRMRSAIRKCIEKRVLEENGND